MKASKPNGCVLTFFLLIVCFGFSSSVWADYLTKWDGPSLSSTRLSPNAELKVFFGTIYNLEDAASYKVEVRVSVGGKSKTQTSEFFLRRKHKSDRNGWASFIMPGPCNSGGELNTGGRSRPGGRPGKACRPGRGQATVTLYRRDNGGYVSVSSRSKSFIVNNIEG